jgi:Protein of unknown function (DUF1176)
MPKFSASLFLILASVACHAEAKPKTPLSMNFGEWTVVCDNVNRCEVITLGETAGLHLSIVRDAGPYGAMRLNLTGDFTGSAIEHVYFDNQRTKLKNFRWQQKKLSGELNLLELSTTNETAIINFLDRASMHEKFSLHDSTTAKKHNISLAGLNESLFIADEVQGRKGNETAFSLKARGAKAGSTVAIAPTAPTIKVNSYKSSLAQKEKKRLINITRKNTRHKECSHDDENHSDNAYALSAQKALVVLECDSAVYNTGYRIFLVSRVVKSAQIESIMLPDLPGKPRIHFLVNAHYEADTGILNQFRKYRGLSDCGNTARWAFDGAQFKLLEYREYDFCKNAVTFKFPRLWYAKLSHSP